MLTRCIDVGGTSIKACVLSAGETDPRTLSRRTRPPISPAEVIEIIGNLADRLPIAPSTAVGFPGVVREGVIVTASNLDDPLWEGFDLAGALEGRLGGAVRVANDADVAALGCSTGSGIELTVTLGTGVGTGLVVDGVLQAHLELSEIPFGGVASLDDYVGEPTRKTITAAEWDGRVGEVLALFDSLIGFDRLWLAGGNARRLTRSSLGDLAARVWVVSEPVGLLGAPRLFG